MLDTMKWAISDRRYPDVKCRTLDDVEGAERDLYKNVRGRHEKVNGRMKQSAVLGQRFRHHLSLHSQCIVAVANIFALAMHYGWCQYLANNGK